MQGRLRIFSTLVALFTVMTFGFAQSNNSPNPKAKKVNATVTAKVDQNQIADTDFAYNTDLYDAISPGFANEVPEEKKIIDKLNLEEEPVPAEQYYKRKKRQSDKKEE